MIKAVVTEYEEIVGVVQDGGGAVPVPTRGDHYVGQLSDVGHGRYLTIDTMTKEDIDNGV